MKKRLLACFTIISILTCTAPQLSGAAQGADELVVYVSERGDDSNSGTENSPFKTIKKAVEVLNASNCDSKKAYIREGTYCVTETIEIKSDGMEVSAYPGEEAEILGAVKLMADDFVPVTDESIKQRLPEDAEDKVLKLDLADYVDSFTEYGIYNHFDLYTGGVRQTIARYPNVYDGMASVKSVISPLTNFVPDFDVSQFTLADSMMVSGSWNVDWLYETFWVTSVDKASNSFFVRDESSYDYGIKAGRPFFVFNMLEGIDVPGEWYADIKTKTLYYYPTDSFYDGADIYLSTADDSVFRLSDGVSDIKIKNLSLKYGKGNAITGVNNRNAVIEGCKIDGFGGYGVKLENAADCLVSSGSISNTAYGVYMTGGDIPSLTASDNKVEQMNISNYSDIGIRVQGRGFCIQKNTVSNSPNRGIDITKAADTTIEYNEIYNVCRERGDAGAVYAGRGFVYRGNIIRYNYIHDVYSETSEERVVGIYLDDQMSGTDVYGNVVKNTCTGILSGGGKDNRIYNNIFIDTDEYAVLFDQRGASGEWQAEQNKAGGIIYEDLYSVLNDKSYNKNSWYAKYHGFEETVTAFETDGKDTGIPDNNYIVNNIYCGEKTGGYYRIYSKVTANWETGSGYPVRMSKEEIGFSGEYDYSLKADSKAFTALSGFENIPFAEIGADNAYSGTVKTLEAWAVLSGTEKVNFSCEQVCNALYYKFGVYKDKTASETVLSGTAKKNFYSAGLGKGKYFFDVKACLEDGTVIAQSEIKEADVLTEYIVYYGFETESTGEIERWTGSGTPPDGIYFAGANASGTANGDSKAEIVSEQSDSGVVNNYVKITKDTSARPAGVQVKLPEALESGVYEYSFDVRLDNHSCRFDQNTFGSSSGYFDYTYMSHSGTLCSQGFINYGSVLQFAGTAVSCSQNSSAEWEKVKVIIDLDNDYAVYYLNNQYVTAKATGTSGAANQNILYLNFMPTYYSGQNGGGTGDGVYCVDNISLKSITNSAKTVYPVNGSEGVGLNPAVTASFKYTVTDYNNISVTENGNAMTADTDYTLTWNTDKSSFEINFADSLNENSVYEVKCGDMTVTKFTTGAFIVKYSFEDFEVKELQRGRYEPSGGASAIYFEGENSSGTSNTGSKAEIVSEVLSDGSSNKVLKITKDSSTRPAGAQIKLPETLKKGVYEYSFDVKFVNHSSSFAYNTFGSISESFDYTYMSHNNTLCTQGFYNYGDSKMQLAGGNISYTRNDSAEWEKVKVIIDLDNNFAAYYFNGAYIAGKQTGVGTNNDYGIRYLNFMAIYYADSNGSADGNGVYYIDNVMLRKTPNTFSTDIISLKDKDNTEGPEDETVYSLAGKTARFTVDISNYTAKEKTGTVVLAIYDKDTLVMSDVKEKSLGTGENIVVFEEKIPDSVSENSCAKIFLFEDLVNVTPLAEACQL